MAKDKSDSSRLIIFEDGTLYHIDLKRADGIPKNLILGGAADRVDRISEHFDEVTFLHSNKSRPEFRTAAGVYQGVPVAAMSIGMGPGPVDIVMNELHALFEYDHERKTWRDDDGVNIIRVGTCGTSRPDVKAGTMAIITHSIGLDNLATYYPLTDLVRDSVSERIEAEFRKTVLGRTNPMSYCAPANREVVSALSEAASSRGITGGALKGIATSSPGFFGPEGRDIGAIRTAFSMDDFKKAVRDFSCLGLHIVAHEMETSGLFWLGNEHLSYRVGAICLVVDNLETDEVIAGRQAAEKMETCIGVALDALVRLNTEA